MPLPPPPHAYAAPARLPAEPQPSAAPRLDQMRGSRRVLLAIAPSADDARLRYQVSEFRRLVAGPDGRDLTLVTIAGARVDGAADPSATLRDRFHVVLGGYRTFLIGKDGHVAMRSSAPIPSEEIAREIDAMPMRREELKRR